MEPFAAVDQLILGRPLTALELSDADALLARASRMVRKMFPDVDTRLASLELDAGDVSDVVCQMVERVLNRPTLGVAAVTDTRGPFSLTERYSNPDGGLYLTDDEKAVFNLDGVTGTHQAFTIDTTPVYTSTGLDC